MNDVYYETVGRTIAAHTAEPGSVTRDVLNLLASWAATLGQAEAANAVGWTLTGISSRSQILVRHRIRDHGIMVIPKAGSPVPTIVHLKEGGPGASDKVSDNASRQRQTQREVPIHRVLSELQ